MSTLRRRPGQRISGALWGLVVVGAGVLMIVSFSGHDVDLELAGILLLAAVGTWLLLSAAVAGIGRSRQVAKATEPTVEEPAFTEPDEADAAEAEEESEDSDSTIKR